VAGGAIQGTREKSRLTVAACVLGLLGAWFVVGVIVALVVGRIVRSRDLQVPGRMEPDDEFEREFAGQDDSRMHRMRNGPR
jgi:hypothetical protein